MKAGLIEGLVFGVFMTFMTVVAARRSKNPAPKDDELIVITPPKFMAYVCAFGVWFFMFGFMGSLLVMRGYERVIYPSAFLGFVVLNLYGYFTTAVQVIIGSSTIRRKVVFIGLTGQREFRLHDLQSAEITWYQGLKLSFRDGRKVRIYALNEDLLRLKPYEGKVWSPQNEGLFRLKQELQERSKRLGNVESYEENHAVDPIPFKPLGLRELLLTGVPFFALAGGLIYKSRAAAIQKINSSRQISLRLDDFDNAFSFYQGGEYVRLKNQFEEQCQKMRDFNCRLASYLRKLDGDYVGELELLRMSCSESDPHSCYNLYTVKLANSDDKRRAEIVLEKVCQQEAHKLETCCTCYADAKANQSK